MASVVAGRMPRDYVVEQSALGRVLDPTSPNGALS